MLIILAIVLILFLICIWLYESFHPVPTQKITKDLSVILCGFVNFYALKTDKGIALFDTGLFPSVSKKQMLRLGLSPEDVTHIFLTHTDIDHAGGIRAFKNAEVFISKDEERMINGETARWGFIHNKRLSGYSILEDKETITALGFDIKIHITPGHTPGSAVYLIDGRYLVTGDLLYNAS